MDVVNNIKNLKIGFVTSNSINSGSMRSRVHRLSQYLSAQCVNIYINENLNSADILVFQKSDPMFLIKNFIKYYGKKFICFDIDDYHPEGEYDLLIQYSNLVVVGSKFLKERYINFNKNIFILDDPLDILDLNLELKDKYNLIDPKIGWFGNICNLQELYNTRVNNVTTITSGGDIEWSIDTVDKNLQKFDLILIPQNKTDLGLAKGNCRMLKILYLGVPALVTDLEAYVVLSELTNYPKEFIMKDGEDWNQRIDDIRNDKIKFDFDFQKARLIILDNFSAEKRGQLWLDNVLLCFNNTLKIERKYMLYIKYFFIRLLFMLNKIYAFQMRCIRFVFKRILRYC